MDEEIRMAKLRLEKAEDKVSEYEDSYNELLRLKEQERRMQYDRIVDLSESIIGGESFDYDNDIDVDLESLKEYLEDCIDNLEYEITEIDNRL